MKIEILLTAALFIACLAGSAAAQDAPVMDAAAKDH